VIIPFSLASTANFKTRSLPASSARSGGHATAGPGLEMIAKLAAVLEVEPAELLRVLPSPRR
jgi:hypothetical protein